jgi:hypothetical protein
MSQRAKSAYIAQLTISVRVTAGANAVWREGRVSTAAIARVI